MGKIKTAVTAAITEKYLEEMKKYCDLNLGGYGVTGLLMKEEELGAFTKGAEIILVEFEEVTKALIDGNDSLRLIICPRGNPVNIDCAAAAARGIPVAYTPGRNANSVAEYIVSSMISVCRSLGRANHEVKNGRYLDPPAEDIYKPGEKDDVLWSVGAGDSPYEVYKGIEISGRTMGFIGLGAVGLRTVQLLSGFDMRFLAYDPYCPRDLAAEKGVELAFLDEVLSQSDFIAVCCKVTPETTGMIGAAEFAKMRKSAYFINTARGLIVRQRDLVEALEQGKIAGAVLDVFWREPLPSNHPLLSMPNVLITPHIGGASRDVVTCQSRMILEEVENYARGRPPLRVFGKK